MNPGTARLSLFDQLKALSGLDLSRFEKLKALNMSKGSPMVMSMGSPQALEPCFIKPGP